MIRIGWAVAQFALLATPIGAQVPPGPVPAAADAEVPAAAIEAQLSLADESLQSGARDAAVGHLLDALQQAPADAGVLARLMVAMPEESAARLWWSMRHALAAADAKGSVPRLDRAIAKAVPDAAFVKKWVKSRSQAATELLRYAQRLPTRGKRGLGSGVLAGFAGLLASELLEPMPAQRKRDAAAWAKVAAAHGPDYRYVLGALAKVLDRAPGAAPPADDQEAKKRFFAACDQALQAARILTGLGAQTGFRNLQGPPPPSIDDLVRRGIDVRSRLRALVPQVVGTWTIDTLEAMLPAEREAFTRAHSTWAHPGRASSPNGLYVIETICGFETLLGAAKTVELHHRRLGNFFGKDPFTNRPGVVRIVPEHAGLESESAPFWWAGGFQSGDLTTIRFAWGSIAGMGRTLTHELTHRFDGVLRPFQPSWLVEGKAVWTAGAYGRLDDEECIPRYLSRGPVSSAFVKGYGGVNKLTELIEGTIEDYRDNYTAGYALYVFLKSWPADRDDPGSTPLFAERFESAMRNARGGRKQPLEWFTQYFCDGEDGRPASLDEFAELFRGFAEACYKRGWGEKIPWLDRLFKVTRPRDIMTRQVRDAPTMSWARNRAEPGFGQAHAAAAGFLLAETGDRDAAIAAWLWSLGTDGWRDDVGAALTDALVAAGRKDVAWVVRRRGSEAGSRLQSLVSAKAQTAVPAPMLSKWSRVRSLLESLATRAEATKGSPELGALFAIEHNDLAKLVRAPAVAVPAAAKLEDAKPTSGNDGKPRPDPFALPGSEPPRNLADGGYGEDGLTKFEDRRRPGLWFVTERGDLHVGRERPRDESGLLDRRARQRDAFALSNTWYRAGRYVVRTRVHFTTSFVRGALVLGYQRRDRNIRIGFRAGDFMYSIGRSQAKTDTDGVGITVEGLWERVPQLDRRLGKRVDFDRQRSYFDVELRVDGSRLEVLVDNERRVLWATPDGSAIAGRIGLAMGQGAVRLQRPTIQRLDRQRFDRDAGPPRFDLAGAPVDDYDDWLGRPVRGLPVGPQGTILVFVPGDVSVEKAQMRVFDLLGRAIGDSLRYPQQWVLALPESWAAKDRDRLKARWEGLSGEGSAAGRCFALVHKLKKPFDERPWVLFVDGVGLLRAAVRLGSGGLPTVVDRWASKSRPTTGYKIAGPRGG